MNLEKMTIEEAYEFISQPQWMVQDGYLYIKPTKPIKYIALNFIAVRTGVTFDEVFGKIDPK